MIRNYSGYVKYYKVLADIRKFKQGCSQIRYGFIVTSAQIYNYICPLSARNNEMDIPE